MKCRIFFAIALAWAITSSAAVPANYYKSCEGLAGANLLKQLESVVGPHTNIGYDALWDLYKKSDVDADGRIWDMYSTKRWATSEKCGSYSAVGSCYNREHSFPKSWFSEGSPMKSDAFHIYPTDGKVNGQRSNYPYGVCASGTTLSAPSGIKALGRLGTSTYPGYSGKVFEPDDEYKGDFARSYFYMAAAYNSKISSWSSDMLARNAYPAFSSWAINLLLEWHRMDPVSQKELNRNEAVYAAQGNRNPFIDYPEMAEYIWGNRTDSRWYSTGAPDPAISLPVSGSTVNFGVTATNYDTSRNVAVRGANLTSAVTASVSDSRFRLSASSLSAASVNAGTASISVTFNSSTPCNASATLTLTCGTLSTKVNLVAQAVDGIPLTASAITSDSFTINWMDLGDDARYTINLTTGGSAVDGYPVQVDAALEEYDIDDLIPETTYVVTLKGSTRSSASLTVTTGAPLPSAQILYDGDIAIEAVADEPSDALELWLDVENIDTDLTLSVEAPFELSTDHSTWARSITLPPLQDRFYIRVNATDAGQYDSAITITAGDYLNDAADVSAFVSAGVAPWWIETWESVTEDLTYTSASITGTACVWNVVDAGSWKVDSGAAGSNRSVRFGKTNSSTIATASAKKGGIGVVSFDLARWNSTDGDITLAIEYSPDGTAWHPAGTVTATSDSYTTFTVPVNIHGDNFLRFRQTAGKRGNIDNISISDYVAGVDAPLYDDDFDAYSLDNRLVISNQSDASRRFIVYNIEGMVIVNTILAHGDHTFALTPGVYLIASDNLVRRVILAR